MRQPEVFITSGDGDRDGDGRCVAAAAPVVSCPVGRAQIGVLLQGEACGSRWP